MEQLFEPIIPIQHLKNSLYQYTYHITDNFFVEFPYAEIEKANLLAEISVEKSETLLRVQLNIQGEVILVCDRSLDEFPFTITTHENMLYQFAEKTEWIEDNLMLLGYDTVEIDLAQLLYEIISVNIPLKRLHPRFENEVFEENEEGEILVYAFSTDGIIDKPQENTLENQLLENQKQQEEDIDPRWADLKNLLNKN